MRILGTSLSPSEIEQLNDATQAVGRHRVCELAGVRSAVTFCKAREGERVMPSVRASLVRAARDVLAASSSNDNHTPQSAA